MSTPIHIHTYIQQGVYVIKCSGEFDETNVDAQFENILGFIEPVSERKFVIFVLGETTYVNSKFIGYIADISNRLEEHGGKLILAETDKIRDTLEICGIHQIIDVFATLDEAQKYVVDNHSDFIKAKEHEKQEKQHEVLRDEMQTPVESDDFFGADESVEAHDEPAVSSISDVDKEESDQNDVLPLSSEPRDPLSELEAKEDEGQNASALNIHEELEEKSQGDHPDRQPTSEISDFFSIQNDMLPTSDGDQSALDGSKDTDTSESDGVGVFSSDLFGSHESESSSVVSESETILESDAEQAGDLFSSTKEPETSGSIDTNTTQSPSEIQEGAPDVSSSGFFFADNDDENAPDPVTEGSSTSTDDQARKIEGELRDIKQQIEDLQERGKELYEQQQRLSGNTETGAPLI